MRFARIGFCASCLLVAPSCESEKDEPGNPPWPCTIFYLDEDGDGWGVDEITCDWDLPDGYAARLGDCCDADPDVHPFADFKGVPHACPILQWDYDCDGVVEPYMPDTEVFTGCGEFCFAYGWIDRVPECGEHGVLEACVVPGSDDDPDHHGSGHDPYHGDPLPGRPWTLPCEQYTNWTGPRGCR